MAKNFLSKASIVVLALLVGATSAFAQKRTVRGVVTDSEGPLAGVSVVLRDPPPDRRFDCPRRLFRAHSAR